MEPPRVVRVYADGAGIGRVVIDLADGTRRVTLGALAQQMGVEIGSDWRPEWDRSPLILRMRDPGFAPPRGGFRRVS